jgi:manganese/iron transport system substrate-binding protein
MDFQVLKDEANMKAAQNDAASITPPLQRSSQGVKESLYLLLAILLLVLAACGDTPAPVGPSEAPVAVVAAGASGEAADDAAPELADPGAAEVLPTLEPVTLAEGEKLRVVASTSLVADIVNRIAGDTIELETLIPLGVDPHTYTATPEDLRLLNDAHLILINGLGLEEALMPVLTSLDNPVPVVSVNAGIAPLVYNQPSDAAGGKASEEAGEEHGAGTDPHTWLSVANVLIWIDNVVAMLSTLDTAQVDDYFSNAGAYREELSALDAELREQINTLPEERRKLVTDHQEFGYFARDYGFVVVGVVIPATSTLASPSAQDLAALQDVIKAEGVPAIFVGANIDSSVVNQLGADLGVEVIPVYTSSLTEADGPAPDYPSLMRNLVNTIVTTLAE